MTSTAENLELNRRGNGQFGTKQYDENPDVLLTEPTGPQWPESFGTPTVTINESESNGLVVVFNGEDRSILEMWADEDGKVGSNMFDGEGPGADEDDLVDIAEPIFNQINQDAAAARSAGLRTFEQAIVAEATGTSPGDEQLFEMVSRAEAQAVKAAEQRDRGAASLVARKVKELHPEAESIRFDRGLDDSDNWYIQQAVVLDSTDTEIASYDPHDPEGSPLGARTANILGSLEANVDRAHWTHFAPEGEDMYEGAYSQINVNDAANWVPGR